jgi:plastocyanin
MMISPYAPMASNPYMASTPYGGGAYGGGYPMMPYGGGYGGYGGGSGGGYPMQSNANYGSGYDSSTPSYAAPTERSPERSPTEVWLYDNYFQPSLITIAAGTTVQWTNAGKHHHTVTSASGVWDSEELKPGESYSRTFTERGVFYYDCSIHPNTMRGTIVVN